MRKFLLMSSALVAGGLLSGVAKAACIQTPTCSSLGYDSSSSCSGGIKCPFGNAWNCTGPNNTTEINKLKTEISSMKTDITNIKNKITELENNTGSGKCQIGSFLFSDKSCSSNLETGKIPIGVVVYLDGTGHGQAIALKSVKGVFLEMMEGAYNRCLFPFSKSFEVASSVNTIEEAEQDFDSCGNTDRLLSFSSAFEAAEKVRSYASVGTQAGDWCMPAAGILNEVAKNELIINNSLKLVDGEELGLSFSSSVSSKFRGAVSFWYSFGSLKSYSVSEYELNSDWMSCDDYFSADIKGKTRPVIEF